MEFISPLNYFIIAPFSNTEILKFKTQLTISLTLKAPLWYNAKFWRALSGRNQSCDTKVSSSAGAYQRIVPVLAIFAQNLALYDKNNRVLLSQALCVIGSLRNLMCKLHMSP